MQAAIRAFRSEEVQPNAPATHPAARLNERQIRKNNEPFFYQMRLENIKVGAYNLIHTETIVLANARDVSFYIADETPQKLKLSIRLSDNPEESNSLKPDAKDSHHLSLVIKVAPGEKLVSREFIMVGTFDNDSKPLYMSFYVSALNDVSRVIMFNFYTLKHGEDVG